jgi:hypothetical protein
MTDRIFLYGTLAGLVVIGSIIGMMVATEGKPEMGDLSVVYGYATMLIALSAVFFGIRRYRDSEAGGVIGFVPALLMGIAITTVAGVIYVLVWEVYLAATQYTFMDAYVDDFISGQKAAGVSGADLERLIAEMDQMKTWYANPLFRLPMTFLEIFPVGVVVSLVSAWILRRRPAA